MVPCNSYPRYTTILLPLRDTVSTTEMTRCESVESTIRKRSFFLWGPWRGKARSDLPSRVMFGTMASEGNPRPGGQFKNLTLMRSRRSYGAPRHRRINGIFPPWCSELRPCCGPLQKKRRGSDTGGSSKQPNGSC